MAYDPKVTVASAQPAEWPDALTIALRHLPEPFKKTRIQNALAFLESGEIDAQGILVARTEDGLLAGGQVVILLKGAGALVWPPQTVQGDPRIEDRLVQAGVEWLRRRGAKVIHALLEPGELRLAGPLLRQGFVHVTRLRYLQHELHDVPPRSGRLRFEAYSPGNRRLFCDTLLFTYEQTLDCPELNGVRTVEEIVAGHMGQGRFDSGQWWLAKEHDRPVGVVMTTRITDGDAWDLSYMGLVPSARGRGLGRELATQAMAAARAALAPQLLLAVDERNGPAVHIYQELGFAGSEIREVFLLLPSVHLPLAR